jgi:ketosteroid isomerase-like protein
MKSRFLFLIPIIAVGLFMGGCSEKTSEQAASAQVASASEQPVKSQFHHSKADSTSMAENVLWDYFDLINKRDYDGVMAIFDPNMRGVYEWEDRKALKNFKSAKNIRIYDMTSQAPTDPSVVEKRVFYVEVDYELNHLFDANDTDGENYRMGVVVREKQDSPYLITELSHVPKLKEVSKDAKVDPKDRLTPLPNPSQVVDQQYK